MKLIYMPKCASSRFQPLDFGMIRGFKCKHRKKLLKYVVSQIGEGKNASEIIRDINIAKAILWLQLAWRDVSTETIINCFQKRWVWTRICQHHFQQMKNLKSLFTQLREDDEITVEDFVTFDDNLTTSSGQINANLIDWRQQAQEEAIKEVVPDTSSASQTVKMVMKMIRRKTPLGAWLYQKHFNTSMICFIFP